jgi:carbonic anhydrase
MSIINQLLDGYRQFYQNYFVDSGAHYKRLVKLGQTPKVLMISCCDSRVAPETITQAEPGDIFTVRNIANIVPPFTDDHGVHGVSAAIEFAVCELKVSHIIILGHSHCGGIDVLLNGIPKDSGFIGPWMRIVSEAKRQVYTDQPDFDHETRGRLGEEYALKISLENLKGFPFVMERVKEGKLKLHAWHFSLETGDLCALDPTDQTFKSLKDGP